MAIHDEKKTQILNALQTGFSREDAMLLTGITTAELAEIDEDIFFIAQMKQAEKMLEQELLTKLDRVIDAQVDLGKESAITWMLERINPSRWNKARDNIESGKGTIILNFDNAASEDTDIVEHFVPDEEND